jgi:prepilin-type N-terminal cleavage/methylation domain-containing protein
VTAGSLRRSRQRGFTLLEIAVTLLIASILLAIAIPRLPRTGRTDLESSSDRLAATMTYLADEASLRGRIYRLTLDLEDDRWNVAALAPFANTTSEADRPEFHEDADDPMARAVALPPGVFFDAVIDHDGETSAGTKAIFFLPEGLTESIRVRLGEQDGARSVVSLDAARGSASREETTEVPR